MNFNQIVAVPPVCWRRLCSVALGFGFLLALLLPLKAPAQGTQTVLSYTNATAITIYDQSGIYGPATGDGSPYPSTNQVPTLSGTLQSLTVTLYGLSDPDSSGIEILLISPAGQALELVCDPGSAGDLVTNATLILADTGAPFTSAPVTSGTYQPSMVPFPNYSPFYGMTTLTNLAGFIGTTLAGTWSLFEYYDTYNFAPPGSMAGGWSLNFTLLATAPAVTNLAASAVTVSNATLNASVNPEGSATGVYFEYGPTTNYGSFSATNFLTANLTNVQQVAQTITGLSPGTAYHFQAVATNSGGTAFGGDLVFVTSPATPVIDITLASGDNPVLTLYGTPGFNYVILSTTNLAPPISWTVFSNLTLSTSPEQINAGPPTNQVEFFRATTPP